MAFITQKELERNADYYRGLPDTDFVRNRVVDEEIDLTSRYFPHLCQPKEAWKVVEHQGRVFGIGSPRDWNDPDNRKHLIESVMEELRKPPSDLQERLVRVLRGCDEAAEETTPSLALAVILMMDKDDKKNLKKSMDILYPEKN